MKNIFKRNQIIITALVIMVVIAAYINFAGSRFNEEDLIAETSGEIEEAVDTTDISEEDLIDSDGDMNIVSSEEELLTENSEEADEDTQETELTEIPSLDSDADVTDTTETPGEAVFTGAASNVGFASEAKLEKEQVRAKNKEIYEDIINNANINDEQKQAAIDGLITLTEIAEKENAAEIMLESQGFSEVVVSMTDNTVDVVVSKSELTDANRAQIEDIVQRKTGVAVENITIIPME